MTLYAHLAPHIKSFADRALSRSVFVATNPTTGTGIASTAAATSRSPTVGLLNVFNGADTATGTNIIIPVYLRLMATTANSNATNFRLAFYTDSANRYSSGGSAITEVECVDSGQSDYTAPTSDATIHFGVLTLAAATDEQLIAHPMVAKTILAASDVIEVYFGIGPSVETSTASEAHLERTQVVIPPVWLLPGANLSVHEFGASQTVDAEFEFEFCYIDYDTGGN